MKTSTIVKYKDLNYWLKYAFNNQPYLCQVGKTLIKLRPRTFDFYVLNEIFSKKIYHFKAKDKRPLTILDLGGNIGLFTLWALSQYKVKRIVIVEPDEENFALLSENLKLNKAGKVVTTLKMAVGKNNGKAHFNSHFINKGMHSLSDNQGEGRLVKTQTLSSIIKLNQLTKVDIMKVDIEGGERYVFTPENQAWFKTNVNAVHGEWHRGSSLNRRSLKKYFTSIGFSFKLIEENHFMKTGIFLAVKKN